jgi:hypothetical protein
MNRLFVFLTAAMLTSVAFGQAEASAEPARGGMHFSARDMDADHDGIITRDEFMKYEANHWDLLPKDAQNRISVSDFEKAMQAHRRKAAAGATGDSPKPD